MKRYVQRAAIVALVVAFGAAGFFKLMDPGSFRDQFLSFGLPGWWVYVTGAVELLGAALVAFSKEVTRRFGAVILATTMAVAAMLHLIHDPVVLALPALALMLLAGYVALLAPHSKATQRLAGA